jgi:predicted RNA-binding protein Jag
VCDNPRRDAKGISENIWNGAGRELMAFGGDIVVVTSEEQCDSEVGELEASGASVAIDTENVAFIDGSGANIAAAAIAQIFQSGQSSLVKKTLIFSLHEWPSLFASFARFLESNIEKIGVTVAHDVSALKKRFPEATINATVDVATIVKSAGYTGSMSLQGMAHAVLGAHVDKRIDHTGWQGPLGERQLRYAATDVYVTMSIYQRACAIVSGTASLSPVVGCRGDDDITEESPKTPTECSRNGAGSYSRGAGGAGGAEAHTISRPGALEILEVIDEVNGPEDDSDDTDEAAAAAANDDERPAANDDADDTGAAHVEGGATLRNISMTAAKQMIKDYAATLTRNTPLQLLQEFSSSERKMLHDYCDNFNLVHQSAGNGRDRHLVISRWKPLAPLLAHEGACAVQALVAKESTVPEASAAGFVRGYVRSFDAAVVKWIARYSDGTESVLELEELNAQLERRYRADHGAGLGPLAPAPLIGGESVEVLYQKLVKGIDPNWRNTDVKYDIRHWLANLSTIGAGDKKGSQFKILVTSLSMALFEILLGEYARWVRHALQLGMSPRLVKLLKRKYLRRRARYAIPEPKILLRRLLDTVVVFSLMEDSLQPGSKFFTADWLKVFLHEMTYVQQGRISDKPLMIMYVQVGVYPSTGMEIWRNRRTTSPLEGYHCHTKLSTSQLARASGPRSKHVRGSLFNFAWTIKAGIMAGLMFNLKHFEPWLVDILYDMYKNENEKPAHLKSWVRLDTEKTPCLVMGVAGPEGINAGKYIPPSMQKSSEWMAAKLGHALPSPLLTEHDIKKVLAHPDMVARGDVGGILRATGLFSSARSLQDLVTRIMLRTKTDAILNSAGASRLLARLRTTAPVLTPVGGVLAAPRAQADVSVGPLPLVGDPRVPYALFSPQSEPPLPSPAPLPAHAPPALPRSPLTAPDGDRTLTLAKLPGLKRKRLRWFSVRLHVSHKDDKDEDRRKNLKRKLEEIGGSWTPPAGLTVPANVSV